MKKVIFIFLTIILSACGSSDNSSSGSNAVNFSSLPTTFQAEIEMDSSVEEGVDAFATFEGGGDVLLAISQSVGSAGGINIDNDFVGKVEVTVSGEHEISSSFARVYKVSKISKL